MSELQGPPPSEFLLYETEDGRTRDALSAEHRPPLLARLDAVRRLGHNLGYGVGDDMDELLAGHRFDGESR